MSLGRRQPSPRIGAVVLAAGRGGRLRPLTAAIPKPLLPVLGRPLIEHTHERLAALGCSEVAINLYHLGEEIATALGESRQGLRLHYSREPELLGTLGALRPLREYLEAAELVLLVNGDSLCRWPLRRLVKRHLESGAAATLLVAPRAPLSSFGGGIRVDERGRVVELRRAGGAAVARRVVFAGAHALSPRLLEAALLGDGPGDIVSELYEPHLAAGGALGTVELRSAWHDLGTPERYLEGVLDWTRGRGAVRAWRRSFIGAGAEVAARARIRRAVLEPGARVERGAEVEDSVVLQGATVGAGSVLRRVIVGPGVDLPAGSRVERRLITSLRAGRDPAGRDSVVGRLVYTPIDSLGRSEGLAGG